MNFCVYILFQPFLDRYYVGSTANLDERVNRHNQGRSKATKFGAPHWKIVYTKYFETRAQAVQFEFFIKKKKSRLFIISLIKQLND